MRIIWYNPDEEVYKSGQVEDLDYELSQTKNLELYTVLMELSDGQEFLARSILDQLNSLNERIMVT